jgi:hypothetical protein
MDFLPGRGHLLVLCAARTESPDDVMWHWPGRSADDATRQDGVLPQLSDLGTGEALGLTVDGQRLATIAEGPRKR